MKTISAVTSWANGQSTEAKVLNAYVINDNLVSSATFYYALLSENEDGTIGEGVAQGNLTMTGEPYTTWQTNGQAWSYVATTLGLTITGDYVPPVPEKVEIPAETINSILADLRQDAPVVEAPTNSI